jgi:hypothetical protein
MTALTVPARPEEEASPRPVPWRRMAWVTWRQHRIALAGLAVFLGVLAVCLWLAGRQLHHAYAAAIAACQPANSLACPNMVSAFDGTNDFLANGFILQAVPVLIGAFVGAPVLARELETGTFRYAWTQGFGRWRWALAKLVLLAVTVAAAAGVFSLRPAYMTPVVTSNLNVPGSAWIISQWWTKGGRFAFAGFPPAHLLEQFCPEGPPGAVGPGGKPKAVALAQCLTPHGYTQWTSYQPASQPAGSGHSNGSRADGCSRCQCCSSP